MANQTGIAIVIKAFLPTGKTLDEQFNALSIVKTAHETGDYAPLLAAASVEEVKAEQKTRRVDDAADPAPSSEPEPAPEPQPEAAQGEPVQEAFDTGPAEPSEPEAADPKKRSGSKAA